LDNRVSIAAILAMACFAIPACAPATAPAPANVEMAKPFEAAAGERLTATPLEPGDPGLTALGVASFNDLPNLSTSWSVRMFGMAGGDPAANGLKTYLAFVSPHDGKGFLLGDFRAYRVITASPGRIDLEIDEDVMGDGGDLKMITRRVIVSWTEKPQTESPNPEFPSAVTITPAS
jgi:hypothetical protein